MTKNYFSILVKLWTAKRSRNYNKTRLRIHLQFLPSNIRDTSRSLAYFKISLLNYYLNLLDQIYTRTILEI
jgi:hypothetical protein